MYIVQGGAGVNVIDAVGKMEAGKKPVYAKYHIP